MEHGVFIIRLFNKKHKMNTSETLIKVVDIFYNATFSRELTERTIFCQDLVTSQKVLFNKTSFLVFDKLERDVHYRYLYYGTRLCATHYHGFPLTSNQIEYENLVIYDYGNLVYNNTRRRLYQIQKELEGYLPKNPVPRSDHKVPDGHVRVYTQEQLHGLVPRL